jgi:hypothetical protein
MSNYRMIGFSVSQDEVPQRSDIRLEAQSPATRLLSFARIVLKPGTSGGHSVAKVGGGVVNAERRTVDSVQRLASNS